MLVRIAIVITALTFLPTPSAAETPEDVANRYFEALQEHGLSAVGDFLHPDGLAKFKQMMMPVVSFVDEQGDAPMLAAFFAGATIEEVEAMLPADFMSGFLSIITAQTEELGAIHFDEIEVLGSLKEADDLVHVLTRVTVGVGELAMTDMEVVSVRPYEGSWRILLTGELEGLARTLRVQTGQ